MSNNIAGDNEAANNSSAASTQVVTVTTELSRQSEKLRSELDRLFGNLWAS